MVQIYQYVVSPNHGVAPLLHNHTFPANSQRNASRKRHSIPNVYVTQCLPIEANGTQL